MAEVCEWLEEISGLYSGHAAAVLCQPLCSTEAQDADSRARNRLVWIASTGKDRAEADCAVVV